MTSPLVTIVDRNTLRRAAGYPTDRFAARHAFHEGVARKLAVDAAVLAALPDLGDHLELEPPTLQVTHWTERALAALGLAA